jgi:hypothetical protein
MASTSSGSGEPSRLDRELMELLQELRVVLPGVQVLFAFLLTVPFAARFGRISDFQRVLFFVAFLSTAASATLLMAPGVQHRLRFRRYDKEALLRSSNRLIVAGTALLAVAMTCALLLVSDLVVDRVTAIVATAAVVVLIAGTWYVAPLRRGIPDDLTPSVSGSEPRETRA